MLNSLRRSISSQKTSSGEASPFISSYHDSMSDSSPTLPFFRFASKRVVAGVVVVVVVAAPPSGGGGTDDDDGGGGDASRRRRLVEDDDDAIDDDATDGGAKAIDGREWWCETSRSAAYATIARIIAGGAVAIVEARGAGRAAIIVVLIALIYLARSLAAWQIIVDVGG